MQYNISLFLITVLIIATGGCSSDVVVLPTQVAAQPTSTFTPVPTPTIEPTPTPDHSFENGLPLVARVNDQPVFLETYQKQVTQHVSVLEAQGVDFSGTEEQLGLDKMNQEILDGLIDQLIIEQQAAKLSITVTETMLDEQIETIITEQGQAYLENWLADNSLSYEDFADRLRFELMANQLFERITKDASDTAQQIFIDWLSQQRKSAIIERY
jgi:hypothetical protein